MPLTIGEVPLDVRRMFERLKHFEGPDETVFLVRFLCLDWKIVVTNVYSRVAQQVGVRMPRDLLITYTTDG